MKQYVVDAFTDRIFHGNQAAVCVLDKWLPDELMMNITRENNFSETASTVKVSFSPYIPHQRKGNKLMRSACVCDNLLI